MTVTSPKLHLAAVNLARRWSIQNEPDMMQENMFEDPMHIGEDHHSPTYDHQACQELASHLVHYSSLPDACKGYSDVAADLKRRDTDTTHPTQILS